MALLRPLLLRASRSRWLEAQFRRRRFARRAVTRFVPGEDLEAALAAVRDLRKEGLGSVLTFLGESVATRAEATAVTEHYLEVLDGLDREGCPRQISVKPTQIGLDVAPGLAQDSLRRLVRAASGEEAAVWLDMEDSSRVDATLDLFEAARGQHRHVGICLQAYLRRTPRDLERVTAEGAAVRLVKGAYREAPDVAYRRKADVDRAFRDLALELVSRPRQLGELPMVLGTHDMHLVEEIRSAAHRMDGRSAEAAPPLEVHMLYGIGRGDQLRLAGEGVPVRVLINYGEAWFAWYMRRLAEHPANLGFVLRSMVRR